MKTGLGQQHPLYFQVKTATAECYNYIGEHGKALALSQEAMMNLHRTNGAFHPDTLHARRVHAEQMGHLGFYDRSLK